MNNRIEVIPTYVPGGYDVLHYPDMGHSIARGKEGVSPKEGQAQEYRIGDDNETQPCQPPAGFLGSKSLTNENADAAGATRCKQEPEIGAIRIVARQLIDGGGTCSGDDKQSHKNRHKTFFL